VLSKKKSINQKKIGQDWKSKASAASINRTLVIIGLRT